MSFLLNTIRNLVKTTTSQLITTIPNTAVMSRPLFQPLLQLFPRQSPFFSLQERLMSMSLYRMHRLGPHVKKRNPRRPLDGNPFMKGVVLKTLIKKPKKPNSANRKCVLVRLSNGKEMVAYIPGIGHNLQEHNVVLCRVGRLRDCPGVKIRCVRGKFDLGHVIPR